MKKYLIGIAIALFLVPVAGFAQYPTHCGTNGNTVTWNSTTGQFTCSSAASGITLQTNGTNNGSQSVLNLAAGSNVTLTDNGSGTVTIASTGGTGTGGGYAGVNNQTGTAYTTVIGDANSLVTMNNAATNTITIPPNSSVAYTIGTVISATQLGAGQTSFAAGPGVTINTPTSLSARAQYSTITVIKIATDTWVATGDLQ